VVTATDSNRLAAQASALSAATLVRAIDELATALTSVREGDDARMAVEIALLKAARPDLDPSTEGLLRRVERLEKGIGESGPRITSQGEGGATGGGALDSSPPVPPAADTPADDDSNAEAPPEEPQPPEQAEVGAGPESAEPGFDLDRIVRVWPAVLDGLRQTSPALAATFEGARPIALDAEEGTVTVGFPADHTFNKRKAEAPDKRSQLADALGAVLGQTLRPAYAVLDGEDARSGGAEEDEVDHDALVEKLKSEFDAEEVS
jgi:DNA polymerase III subunit gamma/tau